LLANSRSIQLTLTLSLIG